MDTSPLNECLPHRCQCVVAKAMDSGGAIEQCPNHLHPASLAERLGLWPARAAFRRQALVF